jgi:hypothetical protein
MKRRNVIVLTGTTLLGLAIAGLPQACFAQSDPFLGTWQLDLTKSKYSPGPPPRSSTSNIQADGQNHTVTQTGIGADGTPTSITFTMVFDGMPHPFNSPAFDAIAATRVDAYTEIFSYTKAGKFIATRTIVVSPDARTLTSTTMGISTTGRPVNIITVSDKQ